MSFDACVVLKSGDILYQGLDCRLAQGYQFYKPIPESEILSLLGGAQQANREVA